MTFHLYAIGSVILVSLLAIIAALPLIYTKKEIPQSVLVILLSLSAGTLLGAVFIHFLPEALHDGYTLRVGLSILAGFMTFFIIEKLVHHHHGHGHAKKHGHGHAYHLAPINLIGDAVHNFLDGLVIAGAYAASIPLGIAATIGVAMHELPQEIADIGVLLYAGISKVRALVYNALAAATAIIGTLVGLALLHVHEFAELIIPFAAGIFLYTAASNLVPELHRHCGLKESATHLLAILTGIGIMVGLSLLSLGHA